jgi:hypothetical protein
MRPAGTQKNHRRNRTVALIEEKSAWVRPDWGRASLDHRGGSLFAQIAQSENYPEGVTKITPLRRGDFSTSKDADQKRTRTAANLHAQLRDSITH